jgi:hypothetical protein
MNLTDENEVVAIIVRYGFDLGGQQASTLVRLWGSKYDRTWLLPATIESLDRGRYKVASIEQVLQGWQRQGKMVTRYTSEFANMVVCPVRSGSAEQHSATADLDPSIDESIDEEIWKFSDQDLAEAHEFAAEIGLSRPALDEDGSNWGESPFRTPPPTPFRSGIASDLAASGYPPSGLRKPGEEELRSPKVVFPPTSGEAFEPPVQVSQFYYRLLQMADNAPGKTPLWEPEESMLTPVRLGNG